MSTRPDSAPPPPTSTSRVLVVGPAWIGDIVMSQSLYMTLRRREPNISIDVLAPGWSLPVVRRMPEVDGAIELPVGHGELRLRARRKLGRRLRSQGYDRAIVLTRSLKSALVPYHARIPVRTGYLGELRYRVLNDIRRLDAERLPSNAERLVALGLSADAPPPEVPEPRLRQDAENLARLSQKLGIDPEAPAIAVVPGAAYGPAKRWPVSYFAALAELLAERGYAIWVLGSETEAAAGTEIAARAPERTFNLCGKTDLVDSVDLLGASKVAVTNDSGLLHMAAAAGTHVVALYGSSSPQYTPPLTSKRTIIHRDLSCSPCFQRECPLRHLRCLTEIAPEEVAEAVERAAA